MDSLASLFLHLFPFIAQAGLLYHTISIKEKCKIKKKEERNINNRKLIGTYHICSDSDSNSDSNSDSDSDGDGDYASDGDVNLMVDLIKIRALRLVLLPVTISLLLYSLINLKHYLSLSSFTKICIGGSIMIQFFKSFLLTFNHFSLSSSSSIPEVRTTKQTGFQDEENSSTWHESQSTFQLLRSILKLAFVTKSKSSKDNKSSKKPQNFDQGLGSDMRFLLKTITNLFFLQSVAVMGLICWKSVNRIDIRMIDNDTEGSSNMKHILYQKLQLYEAEIMTFCWGLLGWTTLEFLGSSIDLMTIILKLINKLSIFLFKRSRKNPYQLAFDRINLNQREPYFKSPYRANSLTNFWSVRWQTVLKGLFVSAGSTPIRDLLVAHFGFKPDSQIVKMAGYLGAFTVSGLIHEFGLWATGTIDPTFKSFLFFFYHGIGVCLESGFRRLTGKKVDGLIGKIWAFSWLVIFGKPMVIAWLKIVSFDRLELFEEMDKLGFLDLLLRPFSIFTLFHSLKSKPYQR